MRLQDLLLKCKEKGIQLRFENARIKYKGPKDKVTPELLSEIKRNKEGLIKYLWPLPDSNLVPFQPLGSKPPYFMVHGDSGNFNLSKNLGNDQPFYCFLHPGTDGNGLQELTSISKITERYLNELLMVKSTGPYYIGGSSIGGVIALEMAIQLKQKGHKVAFLAMFDTGLANGRPKFGGEAFTIKWFKHKLLRIPYDCTVRYYVKLVCDFYLHVLKRSIPVRLHKHYISNFYYKTQKEYKPNIYDGDLYYFKAEDGIPKSKAKIWERYITGSLIYFEIPGGHMRMMSDPKKATYLSNKIKQCLSKITTHSV